MTHSMTTTPGHAMVLLLSCLALSSAAVSQEPLHETIQARQNEWASAFNREDTPALARLYEEDAVLVPPGSRPVKGRSDILSLLRSLYSKIDHLALHTEDVTRLGRTHAVEIGYNTYDAVEDDGSEMRRSDNYIVVWRLDESGDWRYLKEILNERPTGSELHQPE